MCSLAERATAFCRQCAQLACAECVKSHQRMKIFSSHRLSTLDELKEGGAKETVVQDIPKFCEDHEEPLKLYCFDCECLICRDCIIKDHSSHNHDFIKKIATKARSEILEQLVSVKEAKSTLSDAMTEVANTKSEVTAQVDQVASQIKNAFDEAYIVLEKKEAALLAQVQYEGEYKLKQLSAQEKNFATSSTFMQSVIEYAERCVKHSTDTEIVSVRSKIMSLNQEIEDMFEDEDLEPVEQANIKAEVEVVKSTEKVLQTEAKVLVSATH